MNNSPCLNPDCRPVLTIDLKKNRIRIYKQTLHLLDDPKYIQFLVNPETHILAVKKSSENGLSAQKIYWTTLTDRKQCCEFYSKYFVSRLCGLLNGYDEMRCTHRITGRMNQKKDRVFFDLEKSELIDEEPEAESGAKTEAETEAKCI